MTRTIKASEVKPGMTIRWETQVEIKSTTECNGVGGVLISGDNRIPEYLASDAKVTVLSEPAPVQPEEPTEFGARVVAGGCRAQRGHGRAGAILPWVVEFPGGNTASYDWEGICDLGQVTVIPDQGWTVPADSPEVPERIEEWDTWDDVPEGVVVTAPGLFCHYRKNQGVVEFSDPDNDPDWTKADVRHMLRCYSPWTRVTDDAPEVPERIEEWPEDDEHLRAYKWTDLDGYTWQFFGDEDWRFERRPGSLSYPHTHPCDGPWTRVTDA